MRTVDDTADEFGGGHFEELPERVRDALGELAGAAKEGLLALSVGGQTTAGTTSRHGGGDCCS